jgi:hypothetical protein
MNKLKSFIVFVISFTIAGSVYSQTVTTKKETARIKGENQDGYATDLEGNTDNINSAFVKYLKTFGKVKQTSDYITLTEATINGKTYQQPIYGVIKSKDKGAQAWVGINPKEWSADGDEISKHFETLVHDFGVQFYRDKIQEQIDESNRALSAVERQQQRFSNQNRDLNMKLEDNKREKIQLEKSLVDNKTEYETLLKKIEKNKKDQDSLITSNEQIKKVIEAQKARQGKVN